MSFAPDDRRLASDAEVSEPRYGWWRSDLTERMRVLLLAKPLFDMKRGEALRAEELRHYDTLALAVKVWDLIVENLGLDTEIHRNNITAALEPLLSSMDASAGLQPDPARHILAVEHVLDALSNDADRRRPFNVVYQDFNGEGTSVSRILEFRLLWDYLHPSGGIALRLSNEAINLYLRAWELDVEDAQAAAEAVVLSQLNRGKFNEAVQSAKNARLQSIRFWDKITRVVRETRRDIRRVDWRNDAPKLLNEALQHVRSRTDVESGILQTARERLDVLDLADDGARAVAEVCRLIEDCRKRHFDLHGELMSARNVFLDEQERQAFQLISTVQLPSLIDDVLIQLLRMPRADAAAALDDSAAPLVGAIPPPVLSLSGLVAWLLQPRRSPAVEETPYEAAELVPYGNEQLRFPAEIRDRIETLLDDLDKPTHLSELLKAVRDWDEAPELQEYLVLFALRYFAPDDDDPRLLNVQRVPATLLQSDRFQGDELIVSARESICDQTDR